MTTSRRRYHHGALRASILRAAGNILEKQGLEALSLRALARGAKVSHNAPYRHFPDRDALLAALATEGYALLGRSQREAAAGGLRNMGEAYVRFALDHPQLFRLMFSLPLANPQHAELQEAAGQTLAELAGALSARVPAAQAAREASIAAWALVHGLAQLLLDERIALNGRTREEFVRGVLATSRFAAGPAQPA